MYVLDTNVVLDYLRERGKVAANLLAVPPGQIALPAVAAYEIWVGVLGSQNPTRRRAQYEEFLSMVPVLDFDAQIAEKAAELRHAMERKGEAIGPLDTLIAGTALARNASLVTRNVREFGRVPRLDVVNWYD
ncbi:MAG: type II toxin-antitoxin system VapC family toxin [Pseudomonadota bacterium]